MGILEHP